MCSNQLNFFTTYFNIGYAIFLIPSQYFITWFPPSLYLPTLEVSPQVRLLADGLACLGRDHLSHGDCQGCKRCVRPTSFSRVSNATLFDVPADQAQGVRVKCISWDVHPNDNLVYPHGDR